ncbi:hypothetical protein LOAG_00320 [Loa loa]|uniref:Uncharacterized protein n=1 Tax=Loa loa TaxID=7209 RepID=A0A1S0UBQ4_LOALO|nr:hypothetical protein LOAG_00320 [Loa loa]EFO28159.1 hypothetical protein LOAG_00320 [Loa loa]
MSNRNQLNFAVLVGGRDETDSPSCFLLAASLTGQSPSHRYPRRSLIVKFYLRKKERSFDQFLNKQNLEAIPFSASYGAAMTFDERMDIWVILMQTQHVISNDMRNRTE